MSAITFVTRAACATLLGLLLSGCFHPPYNHFQKPPPPVKRVMAGASVGGITGSLISGNAAGGGVGALLGASVGALAEIRHAGKEATILDLQKNGIQFVQYGDTMVLIVPTDRYYEFNSPKLNDICFEGLNNVVKLLKLYKCSIVNVAAFTDNVGTKRHKQLLSQARAETMLTFLWANNIQARRLSAAGYADQFAIGDNHWIRGSAYNRRIEIEWNNKPPIPPRIEQGKDGMK